MSDGTDMMNSCLSLRSNAALGKMVWRWRPLLLQLSPCRCSALGSIGSVCEGTQGDQPNLMLYILLGDRDRRKGFQHQTTERCNKDGCRRQDLLHPMPVVSTITSEGLIARLHINSAAGLFCRACQSLGLPSCSQRDLLGLARLPLGLGTLCSSAQKPAHSSWMTHPDMCRWAGGKPRSLPRATFSLVQAVNSRGERGEKRGEREKWNTRKCSQD